MLNVLVGIDVEWNLACSLEYGKVSVEQSNSLQCVLMYLTHIHYCIAYNIRSIGSGNTQSALSTVKQAYYMIGTAKVALSQGWLPHPHSRPTLLHNLITQHLLPSAQTIHHHHQHHSKGPFVYSSYRPPGAHLTFNPRWNTMPVMAENPSTLKNKSNEDESATSQ